MPQIPSVWREPDFMRLWAATTASMLGSFVTRTALPFAAILVLGAGAGDIAILRSAELVAGLAIGLVAGAWVDRLRRRPILVWADLGRALLLATIPGAFAFGALTLAQLVIVAFGAAILTTFFDTADRAFLPTVIGRERLVEANATLTGSSSAAEFVGFGVGGWLIQIPTAPIAIAVDAVSFLVSAVLLGGIRAAEPPPRVADRRPSVVNEIREGLRLTLRDPILRPLALADAAVAGFWGVFGAVYLVFATEIGFEPGVIGLIAAIGGLSSLAGATFAGRAVRRLGVARFFTRPGRCDVPYTRDGGDAPRNSDRRGRRGAHRRPGRARRRGARWSSRDRDPVVLTDPADARPAAGAPQAGRGGDRRRRRAAERVNIGGRPTARLQGPLRLRRARLTLGPRSRR